MKKKIFIISLLFFFSKVSASNKEQIINGLKKINNLTFEFEQRINEKEEKGNCTIEYPKKIFCEYYQSNNKILISNGKSLVIKTDNKGNYVCKRGVLKRKKKILLFFFYFYFLKLMHHIKNK